MPHPPPPDIAQEWLTAMLAGDFPAAWAQTDRIELPRRAGHFPPDHPSHLVWDGTPFDGRSVHVRCEHGLGDTIQFLRYLPRLRARANRVTVSVQPPLLDLSRAFPGIDSLRNGWNPLPAPAHDIEIECMEFPYAFRDQLTSLPATTPYLDLTRIRALAQPLHWPLSAGLRVGITWSPSAWDLRRSVPFSLLESLWKVPGCTFYSLQQEIDYGALPQPLPLQIPEPSTAQIIDAAAAMLELDLLITVDSMPAHLAGALGVPVWILLRHQADWRWLSGREDSPWYPTARLFRQPVEGDWQTPLAQVTQSLRKLAAWQRHPRR